MLQSIANRKLHAQRANTRSAYILCMVNIEIKPTSTRFQTCKQKNMTKTIIGTGTVSTILMTGGINLQFPLDLPLFDAVGTPQTFLALFQSLHKHAGVSRHGKQFNMRHTIPFSKTTKHSTAGNLKRKVSYHLQWFDLAIGQAKFEANLYWFGDTKKR